METNQPSRSRAAAQTTSPYGQSHFGDLFIFANGLDRTVASTIADVKLADAGSRSTRRVPTENTNRLSYDFGFCDGRLRRCSRVMARRVYPEACFGNLLRGAVSVASLSPIGTSNSTLHALAAPNLMEAVVSPIAVSTILQADRGAAQTAQLRTSDRSQPRPNSSRIELT
jgi:hypothetical protein